MSDQLKEVAKRTEELLKGDISKAVERRLSLLKDSLAILEKAECAVLTQEDYKSRIDELESFLEYLNNPAGGFSGQ